MFIFGEKFSFSRQSIIHVNSFDRCYSYTFNVNTNSTFIKRLQYCTENSVTKYSRNIRRISRISINNCPKHIIGDHLFSTFESLFLVGEIEHIGESRISFEFLSMNIKHTTLIDTLVSTKVRRT